MKNKLNFSYKIVKPRPNNIGMEKINCLRSVFEFKFADILDEASLDINIDQSSINRHIKANRSWSFKGAEIKTKNSIFQIQKANEWLFYQMAHSFDYEQIKQ